MNLLDKNFASLAFEDFAFDVGFDFEKGLEPDIASDSPVERIANQRHARGDKAVVCKHWLRGLCKKGDMCEFLHEYDLQRMPVCYFFSKYGECSNPDCVYRHISAEESMKECPWYNRGFCKHGPNCRNKHVKKIACENYLTGFCPDGPNCKFGHPKYEIPKEEEPQTPTPTVEIFEKILSQFPDRSRVPFRYFSVTDRHSERLTVVRVDRCWHPMLMWKKDDIEGRWTSRECAPPSGPRYSPKPASSTPVPATGLAAKVIPSLVLVSFSVPFVVDGGSNDTFLGTGVIVDVVQ